MTVLLLSCQFVTKFPIEYTSKHILFQIERMKVVLPHSYQFKLEQVFQVEKVGSKEVQGYIRLCAFSRM